MDLVASFIAWLDWQSDRHLDITAMAAVVLVDRDVSGAEAWWWAEHPARTRALVRAVMNSGWMRYEQWPGPDYDVRDLRDYSNVCHQRTIFEVKWTLNRIRDRKWGLIP